MISIKLHVSLKSFQRAAAAYGSYTIKHPFRPFTMPKDNLAHLQALQKQRRRQKVLSAKYPPSQISLQVIGNGSRSDSRSVIIITDHTNYLFNCGEGTQRLSTEHHSKLSKLEHIFVTKPSWDNMGGIPGILLTVQDTGVLKVHLHGPEGTGELLDAIDNFVNINQLDVLRADTSQTFTDHTMSVDYVTIKNPKFSEEAEEDNSDPSALYVRNEINFYNDRPNNNGKRPRSPGSPKSMMRKEVPPVMNRINTIMVYACKIHPKPGAININKLLQLQEVHGAIPGPDIGKLKAGTDVTHPNGTIIRSADVVDPTEPGPLFIVLECPNEDWIDVIVDNPAFLKYQERTAEKREHIASYIIHFTPTSVLKNTRYREWMSKFGNNTEHLIINEDTRGYSSESIHKMQHQLHLINGQMFPFLENKNNFAELNNIENGANVVDNRIQPDENGMKIHYCKTLNVVRLRRHNGFENSEVRIKPREYVQEALNIDGFCDAIADLQTELNNITKASETVEEYPKLVFLGTGCSIPNKIRNTSSILLQLSETNNIMLDCGEGTAGQLIRFFGEQGADHILKHLNAIYVSHLHADHHLGFIGLVKQRERVTDEPLFLIAPHEISHYLNFYHRRFESISKGYRVVSNKELLLGQSVLAVNTTKELYARTELSNISTVYVKHCPSAYGVAITLKDGRKICYSGDTIPCDSLVKLAADSFLLIHEATMEDGLEAEAMSKRHSTISQAVNVGVKANVNFTMLTHFSQRYSKMPMLPSRGIDLSRVGIAYDFMQVKLSELPLLPWMYPSFSLLFSEFRAQLDEKANKRLLQQELDVDSDSLTNKRAGSLQ